MKDIESQAIEYAEALNDIADVLDMPTGATSSDIVKKARNRWASGIHTCHDGCTREMCAMRREVKTLRAELESEREKALDWFISYQELKTAVADTLEENCHLADGDQCTLKKLKDAYAKAKNAETSLDSENEKAMHPLLKHPKTMSNHTPPPETSSTPQPESGSGLHELACSTSSTPESDAGWERYIETGLEEEIMFVSQKLERERDAARAAIRAIVPDSMTFNSSPRALDAARKLLPENVQGLAQMPAPKDSNS